MRHSRVPNLPRASEVHVPISGVTHPDFCATPDALATYGWACLNSAVSDRRSGFRTISIANLDLNNAPDVRTVVLRDVDLVNRMIRFHTDRRASKVQALLKAPSVMVLGYAPELKLQIRMSGVANVITEGPVWTEAWQSSQHQSRACYSVAGAPGSDITNPSDYDISSDFDHELASQNFCAVQVQISSMDALYLDRVGHRRMKADYSKTSAIPAYTWVIP